MGRRAGMQTGRQVDVQVHRTNSSPFPLCQYPLQTCLLLTCMMQLGLKPLELQIYHPGLAEQSWNDTNNNDNHKT